MNRFRGWIGEKKTSFRLKLSLDKNLYVRFNNVIIPSNNGTTQIDHLILSPFGIFIIETKNKKGWIFGSENQAKWTQVIFKQKYLFQNPLKQAYRQKKVLSEFLNIDGSLIKTIIYFNGDCSFKTSLPPNVLNGGLANYIKQYDRFLFNNEQINRLIKIIHDHISESNLTNKDHIRSLRNRHSSNTVCPKCGSRLVERIAKKGPNAGSSFLGCESYPKCKFTKDF